MNYTPAEHAEILRSYIEQGKRIGDFKRDYRLDDRYVSAIVLRFNIKHKDYGAHRRTSENDVRKWASLYEAGRSITYISKNCGSSSTLIGAYLRAYEIKQGDPENAHTSNWVNPAVYRRAAIEAAEYWKDRCEKHYKFWQEQAQAHSI